MKLDRVLGVALIDRYARCDYIETAHGIFEEMPDRDLFAFISLISGLANHDLNTSAIEFLGGHPLLANTTFVGLREEFLANTSSDLARAFAILAFHCQRLPTAGAQPRWKPLALDYSEPQPQHHAKSLAPASADPFACDHATALRACTSRYPSHRAQPAARQSPHRAVSHHRMT
ncbi:hypothetical protein TorRG33x02_219610 [Trema orientale]|uniref:Pentatricopeptide repeat n=1 Tax=Trema orientale TaxID=63057 RepID=A0A2P5E9N0_TREOI|nr:hypothetical protein TorRG33x02_219610 [Trema orientale]